MGIPAWRLPTAAPAAAAASTSSASLDAEKAEVASSAGSPSSLPSPAPPAWAPSSAASPTTAASAPSSPATRQAKRAARRSADRLRIRYRRPWLYKEQEDFLFTAARYSIVEASTKTGKTTGCLVWLVEKACLEGFDGWNGWWVAPVYSQAKIAYDRFKRFAKGMKRYWVANDTEMSVRIANGAKLWFKSGEKPDNLYGDDVHAAVLDEATRMREASWIAIRSTLTATRGQLRIIGNVKGTKNWCYKLARLAQGGEPNMYYAKLTAWHAVAAGILAVDEVLDAKRMLPAHVYEELYLAIPAEDGANPFGLKAITDCTATIEAEIAAMLASTPVIFGIDLGRKMDWTVLVGLDAAGRVCRFHRFQMPWREAMAEIRRIIGRTPALIDATGIGDPITELLQRGELPLEAPAAPVLGATSAQRTEEALQQLAYDEEQRRRAVTDLQQACPNLRPFVYTSTSKQLLMERLALVIQNREVRLIPGPGDVLKGELEAFEFAYSPSTRHVRYQAPDGMHDDCVNALALAVEGRAFASRYEYAEGDTVAF